MVAPRRSAEALDPVDGDGEEPAEPAASDLAAMASGPNAGGNEAAQASVDDADMAAEPDDSRDLASAAGEHPGEGDPSEPGGPHDSMPETADSTVVDGPVAEALEALHGGDFDRADDLLASALADAGPIPARERVSDWQILAGRARDFADYRDKALAGVRSGNEYDVNGKKVAVVEIDEDRFVYRFQGKNRACDRGKIPAGIVLAIVTEWFDARPANHLFLGAWHATKPEPDLARAREHWETAERGGIDAGRLLRLLDDPVLLAAVPSDDDADPAGDP